VRLEPLGDAALIIELAGGIDTDSLARVRDTVARLEHAAIPGITDLVPGYASVAVHYDPLRVLGDAPRACVAASPSALMRQAISAALDGAGHPGAVAPSRNVEIPVAYGGEHGPDLAHVAAQHGLTCDEVVALHTGATYLVHMIGFVPGFPYLGGLDPRLETPRRDTPRPAVPAGSVGIGGAQTGIYPIESPGGWQLIGRTPLSLFDAMHDEPARLRVGDCVTFTAITGAEYARLAAEGA